MTDYLQPVGGRARKLAAAACLLAAILMTAITSLLVVIVIQNGPIDREGKPFWIAPVIFGLIALACWWLSARLFAGRSANGVTILPIWFIELFGALFLIAIGMLVVRKQWHLLLVEGVFIAAAMLLIRRQVRKRLREQREVEESSQSQTGYDERSDG